jgi:hypothetical protein
MARPELPASQAGQGLQALEGIREKMRRHTYSIARTERVTANAVATAALVGMARPAARVVMAAS